MSEKNRNVISVYSQLSALRRSLKYVNPKYSRTNDRVLASVGYPARFLAFHLTTVAPILSKNLMNLSNTISDYRMFHRVINTPATVEWALDLLLDNKNSVKTLRYIDYVQAIAGVGYQVLEDLAYLGSKGILRISPKTLADLWVISCLFWAAHVIMELVKVGRDAYYDKPVNYRALWINLAWSPLVVHWSTYKGVFDNGWVGLLGTAAVWPDLAYKWNL